jgi:hypothetical protein
MKRFRRWLFNGLAVLSLLLCMATAVMWFAVSSSRGSFGIDYASSPAATQYNFVAYPGGLFFSLYLPSRIANGSARGLHVAWYRAQPGIYVDKPSDAVLGFAYQTSYEMPGGAVLSRLDIPYWFIIALTLVSTLVSSMLLLFRSANRLRQQLDLNCCVHCGYDLRATPDRCPECGTVPKKGD